LNETNLKNIFNDKSVAKKDIIRTKNK